MAQPPHQGLKMILTKKWHFHCYFVPFCYFFITFGSTHRVTFLLLFRCFEFSEVSGSVGPFAPHKAWLSFLLQDRPDPGTDFWAPGSLTHHRFRHLLERFSKGSWRRFERFWRILRLRQVREPYKNPSETPSETGASVAGNESLEATGFFLGRLRPNCQKSLR